MTTAEHLAHRLASLEATAHHAARLIEALGDPTAWEYTGVVHDAGPGATERPNPPRCACGHPIRFLFAIRATRPAGSWRVGDETHVGSVCIRQIADLAPELARAIGEAAERLERELREAEARARRAAAEAQIAELRARWEALWTRAWEAYRSYPRGRAPAALWRAVASTRHALPGVCPQYQRPGDYVRWYKAQIAAWERVLAEAGIGVTP